MKIDTNPIVKDIIGGSDLIVNIPFLKNLVTPVSFLTWIIAILAIMPFIVWIVCIAVILINAVKWVKSNGNEKEVESAKTGMKRALIGFISMFFLFILANLMSNFFIGTNFDSLVTALAPCKGNQSYTYTFDLARRMNISLTEAYKVCGY